MGAAAMFVDVDDIDVDDIASYSLPKNSEAIKMPDFLFSTLYNSEASKEQYYRVARMSAEEKEVYDLERDAVELPAVLPAVLSVLFSDTKQPSTPSPPIHLTLDCATPALTAPGAVGAFYTPVPAAAFPGGFPVVGASPFGACHSARPTPALLT